MVVEVGVLLLPRMGRRLASVCLWRVEDGGCESWAWKDAGNGRRRAGGDSPQPWKASMPINEADSLGSEWLRDAGVQGLG